MYYHHQTHSIHEEIYSMEKSGDFPNITASKLESWIQIHNLFQIPCSENIRHPLCQMPIQDFLGWSRTTPTMERDLGVRIYHDWGGLGGFSGLRKLFFGTRIKESMSEMVLIETKGFCSLPSLQWSHKKCRDTKAWCVVKKNQLFKLYTEW